MGDSLQLGAGGLLWPARSFYSCTFSTVSCEFQWLHPPPLCSEQSSPLFLWCLSLHFPCTFPSGLWAVLSYVSWLPTVVAGDRTTDRPVACPSPQPLRAKVGLGWHTACCLGTDYSLRRIELLAGGRLTSMEVRGSRGVLSLGGSLVGSPLLQLFLPLFLISGSYT